MSRSFSCVIADNADHFADLAARCFVDILETIPQPLVTLPTGLTPQGFYQALIRDYAHRHDLWASACFVALDEYMCLPADDERLFGAWLTRACLDPLRIENRQFFQSDAPPHAEVTRMERFLAENGPLDIAVLGLGANGHIAFNEPGTAFDKGVHLMELTPASIAANALYWGSADRVPQRGITMGLADLIQARHTLLLVTGAAKAPVLRAALQGPVTTDMPASYLQTIKNVTILADRDAASLLT